MPKHNNKIVRDFIDLLEKHFQLPPRTTAITVTLCMEDIMRISCTYIPNIEKEFIVGLPAIEPPYDEGYPI